MSESKISLSTDLIMAENDATAVRPGAEAEFVCCLNDVISLFFLCALSKVVVLTFDLFVLIIKPVRVLIIKLWLRSPCEDHMSAN